MLVTWWPVAGPALTQAQDYALALVIQPHARPQPDAAADTDPAALTNGLAYINHYPNRNTRPDGYPYTDRYANPASHSHQYTASYTDLHCHQHPAATQPHRPSRGCQA